MKKIRISSRGCIAHDISLNSLICNSAYKRDNKIKKRSSENYKTNKVPK